MSRPRCYRKVIKIRAVDSPNVRYALQQQKAGIRPTGEVLVEGLLGWEDYQKRLATWTEERKTVGLEAEWYEGSELLLFPPTWLTHCTEMHSRRGPWTTPRYIGCDPAEGGDKSTWIVSDSRGVLRCVSIPTPDTNMVYHKTIALMGEYGVPPSNVLLDRGGGGKQHADRLREKGYPVRTIAFGETLGDLEPKRGIRILDERKEAREDRYVYFNRRSEMYGEASILCDPTLGGYAIPDTEEFAELRRQLSLIPKVYDGEDKLRLPPKNRRNSLSRNESSEVTLVSIIGHSPDEADAFVLSIYARIGKKWRKKAGAVT